MLDIRQLVKRVRILSSQRESSFLYDSEIADLLQIALNYIYNQIIMENENFFLKDPVDITLNQNQNSIVLSEVISGNRKLFKIRSLVGYKGDIPYPLEPITIQKLADYCHFKNWSFYDYNNLPFVYVLEADKIKLYPENNIHNVDKYELRYVLEAPIIPEEPVNAEGEPDLTTPWELDVNIIHGIDDFLVYHASSDAVDMQQLKSNWLAKAKVLEQQIMSWVQSRDTSYVQTVRKVRRPKTIGDEGYGIY